MGWSQGSAGPRARRVRAALLITMLAAAAALPAAATTVSKAVHPARAHGKVCLRAGGQEGTYYPLRANDPLELSLYGPGKLRLLTRHLPRGTTPVGRRSYTLVVVRDGKEVLHKKIRKGRSSSATLCDDLSQAVGVAVESRITVPTGKHDFRVYIVEAGKAVAVRMFLEKNSRKASQIAFTPYEFDRLCTIVLPSGNEYAHFHATAEQPVRLMVHGPTQLTIRTRADCPSDSSAGVRYGVEVLRDGESHQVFHYRTRRYSAAHYRDCAEFAPGSAKRIDLEVPEGTWTYELRPADAETLGFTVRILIPKDDVGPGSPDVR